VALFNGYDQVSMEGKGFGLNMALELNNNSNIRYIELNNQNAGSK
jgi:hypothetical protein